MRKKQRKSAANAAAVFVLSAIFVHSAAAASGALTDRALAAEIRASFSGGFYPAVLSSSERFLAQFPVSEYATEINYLRAESLYRLGRFDEAHRLALSLPESPQINSFLARSFCTRGNYRESLRFSYAVLAECSGSNSRNTAYYADAVLAAGKSLAALAKPAEAAEMLETLFYADIHVKLGAAQIYDAAAVLFSAYKNLKQDKKLTALYEALFPNPADALFSVSAREWFQLQAADSYAASGNISSAMRIYTQLLHSADKQTASSALLKAYLLCTQQPDARTSEAELLETASKQFGGDSEILAEFWVRAGINAWNRNDTAAARTYFENADAYALPELRRLSVLYRSRMADPESAVNMLEKNLDAESAYYADYLAELAVYAAENNDWEKTALYASKLLRVPKAAKEHQSLAGYLRALCAFRNGQYAESAASLEKMRKSSGGDFSSDADGLRLSLLYAQSLFCCARTEDALAEFEKLAARSFALLEKISPRATENDDDSQAAAASAQTEQIASVSLINSARAFLAQKQSAAAAGIASRSANIISEEFRPVSLYLAEAAAIMNKEWKLALHLFDELSQYAADNARFSWMQYAQYYAAYAAYRIGAYDDAYNRFEACADDMTNTTFAWNALFFSAKCAALEYEQTNQASPWLPRAVQASERALKYAPSDKQRIDALLLAAGVYANTGRYDDAAALLSSYTNQNTEVGMICLYRCAQIYAAQKRFDDAASAYIQLEKRFPSSAFAEEAAYRCGELYYNAGEWLQSAEYLARYRRQYPSGRFSAAALCFNADACFRMGNESRALLLSRELTSMYPESPYMYQTQKNLVLLYKKRGEYKNAYSTARSMVQRFGETARKDGIESLLSELSLLVSGEDERTAQLISRFSELGKEKTPKGREAGLELAAVYISMPEKRNEGIRLAETIRKQCGSLQPEDKICAAHADFMLGNCCREDGDCKKAAPLFLSAAELYAAFDRENAAQALYCALEAFSFSGRFADAEQIYETLRNEFADSVWTRRADAVIKE
ncbi:MAG: tetratricopeptide repeat protein [Bacteroides sp.]|nr:tetratricopeptide repeat protein [Prevotella sp.]MCM1408540.1 tetratricopeptide repeat protein [Treponema brennaborense]MCM1470746.1 tetratricopeptide repeat protein [Bacteroides sp.]